MDEKMTEGMQEQEQANPNTRPEAVVPIYTMKLQCPNCGQSFDVETPFGTMFPEGKIYVCPNCGFKEYAGYEPCRHCGSGHKYRFREFTVGASWPIAHLTAQKESTR